MPPQPVKVVSVAQMQALEAASERAGVSRDALMENAGLACARRLRQRMGGAAGRRVVVLVGPGNNGADGLVTARCLRRWGAEVCCYVVRSRPADDPKMTAALAYDIPVLEAADDPDFYALAARLARSDLIVDAILGAGRYRPPDGIIAAVSALVNRHRRANPHRRVAAIDLPTGVDPDTGATHEHAIRADETLALGFPKLGIAAFPGAGPAGRITVLDIGLPPAVAANAGLPTDWITAGWAGAALPPRPLNSHKGDFGHLLIVAGARDFVGAACLAARGAHRAGAGLVTLAAPESAYRHAATQLTETIHLPLPEDGHGRIDASAAAPILARIGSGGYSALAIGCGLGRSDGVAAFIRRLLLDDDHAAAAGMSLPTVIDADGLNNLSRCANWPARLRGPAILTPHPGEMATLTARPTAAVQSDRLAIAGQSARDWGQTVLLKGAHSIVAAPDGRQAILPFANPALAAGGTGDVLTGIIGGLLAQGAEPYAAAALGGFLHAAAAEKTRALYGDAGVVASDLLERLPPVMRDLRAAPASSP